MGQGGKCDIPFLCSNDQTFITSTDKAVCFAYIFVEKSNIPEADNKKPVHHEHRKTSASLKLKKTVFWPKKVKDSAEACYRKGKRTRFNPS